jgi:hypothetical protein
VVALLLLLCIKKKLFASRVSSSVYRTKSGLSIDPQASSMRMLVVVMVMMRVLLVGRLARADWHPAVP